jgi:hypothetical protein
MTRKMDSGNTPRRTISSITVEKSRLHSLTPILANKGYGDVTHKHRHGIVHGAMPVDGIQGLSRHLILLQRIHQLLCFS